MLPNTCITLLSFRLVILLGKETSMTEEGLPDPLYTVSSSPDLASYAVCPGRCRYSELAYSAPNVLHSSGVIDTPGHSLSTNDICLWGIGSYESR